MQCDDDDDTLTSPTGMTVAVATTSVGSVPNEILVTTTDYKFGGLPTSAPVGSKFTLQNASTKEVHEMVIYRIPDEVTQSIGELLALPEEEQTRSSARRSRRSCSWRFPVRSARWSWART